MGESRAPQEESNLVFVFVSFFMFSHLCGFLFPCPLLFSGEWRVHGDRGFGVGRISLSTLISHFGQSAAL